MSTLRVTNIEAKGDPSSPSVDEKLKLTNSTGDIVLEVDGKNVGAGQTVFVGSGIVTATSVNANVSATTVSATTVSATTVSVAGSITATNLYGDASSLTGIDATALKSGGVVKVQANTSGSVTTGVATATDRVVVGNAYIKDSAVGVGTTTATGRDAGIGTAVGSINYVPATGLQVYVGSLLGWRTISGTAETDPIIATGGTVDTSSRPGYKVHTFTGSGNFVISSGTQTVEYLVIAGGGGGGGSLGGGGAGGYREGTVLYTPGTHTVTIGGGGSGGTWAGADTVPGVDSSIVTPTGTLTSTGGGGGAGPDGATGGPGAPGGSGGGGRFATPGGAGNTPPVSPPQGNPGGDGDDNNSGAGGGGAGAAGSPAPATGGVGGDGASSSITGSAVTRAGGGGGGYYNPGSGTAAAGGAGGGGAGGYGSQNGTAATANTGGGGGGSGSTPSAGQTGGNGGSGVVIIAYSTS